MVQQPIKEEVKFWPWPRWCKINVLHILTWFQIVPLYMYWMYVFHTFIKLKHGIETFVNPRYGKEFWALKYEMNSIHSFQSSLCKTNITNCVDSRDTWWTGNGNVLVVLIIFRNASLTVCHRCQNHTMMVSCSSLKHWIIHSSTTSSSRDPQILMPGTSV